ncbi:MAG: right-handed parallel beta-helix repeat-containing protein, partial [Thermoguttaceae bacterium]|nr:right-handed parallel beta-helix repeat-containing protein [Thermoguttaceae bacterium]
TFNIGFVANASSYAYEYSTNADFTNATSGTASASGDITVSDLPANTTYYFRAKAIGDGKSYVDSGWSTTPSATTDKIDLAAPEVSATPVSDSAITFEIGFVANASGYKYEYSTSPNFAESATTSGTTTKSGEFTVPGLSPFTTYYFRAKAIGEDDYETSAWSETESAKTAQAVLAVPEISAVATSSTEIDLTIKPVANASSYAYMYSTNADFSGAKEISTGSGTITLAGLNPGTTYYFKAIAKGVEGGAYLDSAWTEATNAATPLIILDAPKVSAVATSASEIELTIQPQGNAVDNADALNYVYEYSTSADFSNATTVVAGTHKISGLDADTLYYFRAKAVGTGDYADSEWKTTTAKTKAILNVPVVAATPVDHWTLEFEIGEVAGALGYVYQYSTDPNFAENVIDGEASEAGTFEVGGLNTFTTYYFRAQAVNGGVASDWSDADATTWEAPSMTVTTETDVVDPTDGLISLREAACVYSATDYYPEYYSAGDVVAFADNVATVQLTDGEIAVVRTLAFVGGGVTVDAQSSGRVFNVVGGTSDAPVSFNDLTITGGAASHGAGVYVSGAATFENVTFTSNEATVDGGGVYVATGGYASLTDVDVTNNKSKYGAGVYVYGEAELDGVVISDNVASDRAGGLDVSTGGVVEAVDVVISANQAKDAAGVWIQGSATVLDS